MLTIKTMSGSIYEIDQDACQIRRLSGTQAPTSRQGRDGTWRKYADITKPEIGRPIYILWADESVGQKAAEGCLPGTTTNLVAEIWDGDPSPVR